MDILRFEKVKKSYGPDATALTGISFLIEAGEFAALSGPSGSGKSTILNLAAGLDRPSEGTVFFRDQDLGKLNTEALFQWRRSCVGFVFQAYNLFPVLTALENVEYPLALNGVGAAERKHRSAEALRQVGLGELANRFPAQLSGGQQQRVAIARAIVSKPSIVFADEPTANLDSKTAEKLLQLFHELNQSTGITFLFSSHDPMVLRVARRVLEIADGAVQRDLRAGSVTPLPPRAPKRVVETPDELAVEMSRLVMPQ